MAKHSHQKGHTTALVVCWPTFHRNVTLCAFDHNWVYALHTSPQFLCGICAGGRVMRMEISTPLVHVDYQPALCWP